MIKNTDEQPDGRDPQGKVCGKGHGASTFHDKAFYEEGKQMTNNKWNIPNHTKDENRAC